MNCAAVRLEDRALEFLDSTDAAEVDRHLEGCAACRTAMTRVRMLLDRLEELPGERSAEPLVRSVMRNVSPKPKRHWEGRIMLTAASLLLAGVIGIYVAQDPPKTDKPVLAQKQDAPHAKEIDKLVERLGGNDVEDRDKAEKELVDLAKDIEHALAALEKARKSGDAELSSRAGRAVKSLRDAIAKLGTPAPAPVVSRRKLSADDAARLLAEAEARVKVKPADPQGWTMHAEALLELGQPKEAMASASRAVEIDPTSAPAHVLRGRAGVELQLFDGAVADFSKAIELDPKLVDAYAGRGEAYKAGQKYEEALRDLDNALRLDPSRVDVLGNRGKVRQALGDDAGAAADFKRAHDFDTNRKR